MLYKQCVILLPCHSLEDFPTHHDGDDAQGLLAGWTALFHPGLLAMIGKMPEWWRVDDPGDELADSLLVIPNVSSAELPTGFAQRAKNTGAIVIRRKLDRDEIITTALEPCDEKFSAIDSELVADFLALGYAYLQIELLTRQMRYSCNLDEVYFSNEIVAGAKAALEGDVETAKQKLTSCFDVLAEERDNYYAVEAFIVDLTLVAPTTIGLALQREVESDVPFNLLMTGEVVDKIATEQPETLAALKSAVDDKRVSICGGEQTEERLPMLSLEHLLSLLKSGPTSTETHAGAKPKIFGRRTYGLSPVLPQLLTKLGYVGAIHATLDDGRFPEGQQLKTRWEGTDKSVIDAISRAPLNAAEAGTFLGFATKLGETMDMDHVATLFLAHWPGQASCWFEDLKRIAKYGPLMGKFVRLEDYFSDTDFPAHLDHFDADLYRTPYLKQAVIRSEVDPISSHVRYWQDQAATSAQEKLIALTTLMTGKANDEQTSSLTDATAAFADALPRKSDASSPGYLLANPLSFTRRMGVELPGLATPPTIEKPVYTATEKYAVVDVPAMGFAWVTSGAAAKVKKPPQPLIQDLIAEDGVAVLQNEFFEATINSVTGTLKSFHDYKSRGNRLSQQLAMRLKPGRGVPEHEASALYSVMAADSAKVLVNTSVMGEVKTTGRLLEQDGTTVATFKQRYQIWRGSRVLRLQIEITAEKEMRSDPWNSYCGLRFAWADEAADLWRTVNETRQKVDASNRFESSHYVEIDSGKARTAILTGGLPYHRRQGLRMLDTILLVRGETQTQFEIGIGMDLTHPMQQATELLTPVSSHLQDLSPTSPADSSWLLHLSAKNVQATHLAPIIDDGTVRGFRTRILETDGRAAKVKLSSFRTIESATKLDFQGNVIDECTIEDGAVILEMAGHEWAEIEARW